MAAITSIVQARTERANKPLAGTVSLVTGASRGIGAAIARDLAGCGSHVVIDYTHDEAGADFVVTEILLQNGTAEKIACDVSDHGAVKAAVADLLETHGHIDIVVNNAGILRDRSFLKLSQQDWNDVISVNLNGVMNVCASVVPGMVQNGYGRIVNISSFVAQTGNFGQTNYAAAKAGMIGFTRALALEVARKGVTVNAVCPGFIETNMWRSIPTEVQENILARIPMRRVGSPEDVASAVRFLVLDADYMTGQTLNINGGIYIG